MSCRGLGAGLHSSRQKLRRALPGATGGRGGLSLLSHGSLAPEQSCLVMEAPRLGELGLAACLCLFICAGGVEVWWYNYICHRSIRADSMAGTVLRQGNLP